jgi:hypothetical protein
MVTTLRTKQVRFADLGAGRGKKYVPKLFENAGAIVIQNCSHRTRALI